jgi:hypothetical protein
MTCSLLYYIFSYGLKRCNAQLIDTRIVASLLQAAELDLRAGAA